MIKCSKCQQIKELAKGRSFCKECKNAYERNRKRGTAEARAKTNQKQKEALEKKKKTSCLVIDPSKVETCTLCKQEKTQELFHQPVENGQWECSECYASKCSRCHLVTKIVKGKWCLSCKNKYEQERRSQPKNKEKIRNAERERYHQKKRNLPELILDSDQQKICSICKQSQSLDNFYVAKQKGTIRAECKECAAQKRKEYYYGHKVETIKQNQVYQNNRTKVDPAFKLLKNMRSRLYHAVKRSQTVKSARTMKLVGCTPIFLKEYLEKKFKPGMTWENYGKWHVDHIKPCCQFNLESPEEQQACFHYSNLQPLWAEENYCKGKKY